MRNHTSTAARTDGNSTMCSIVPRAHPDDRALDAPADDHAVVHERLVRLVTRAMPLAMPPRDASRGASLWRIGSAPRRTTERVDELEQRVESVLVRERVIEAWRERRSIARSLGF